MPRIPRNCMNTSFFHVIVQGIEKEFIFNNTQDIEEYLKIIKIYKNTYDIEIIAYCIMGNHAHFLIYSEKIENLTKFMHKINMIYAMFYNKKYSRVGYVFRNRFLSEPIYNEKYLFNCIVYIHRNPIEAKICNELNEYKYSSYIEYVGKNNLISYKGIFLVFGSKDYREIFNNIHNIDTEINYIDIKKNKEEFCKERVEKFLIENNVLLKDIKSNRVLIKKLLYELKIKNDISYRIIEKVTGIGRECLRNNLPK